MRMNRFSARTDARLRSSGWYPGRTVDTSNAEKVLASIGFDLFPIVIEFLAEFGDLAITYVTSPPQVFEVGVEDWLQEVYPPSEMHNHNIRAGGPITHIGTVQNGEIRALMNEEGNVFGLWSGLMWEIGASGDDALEALCAGRDWTEIP